MDFFHIKMSKGTLIPAAISLLPVTRANGFISKAIAVSMTAEKYS